MTRLIFSMLLVASSIRCFGDKEIKPQPDIPEEEETVPLTQAVESAASGKLEIPVKVFSNGVQSPTGELSPLNQYVLWAVKTMPEGGKYSVSRTALNGLKKSVVAGPESSTLQLEPEAARPSFCSGATYLVFLKVLQKLEEKQSLKMTPADRAVYAKIGQPDGVGIWGRWNANGPGTAGLFHELGCGSSFSSFEAALPGDFLKIWWTEEIGSKERGHSVIYLGSSVIDGEPMVQFWSSNIPDGYGTKSIPRSKIARALFSRLNRHDRMGSVTKLAPKSQFLADMLKKEFTWEQVVRELAVKERP